MSSNKASLREKFAIISADALIQGGAVGVIVQSPADAQHTYKVRFNDGAAAMHQELLAARKCLQRLRDRCPSGRTQFKKLQQDLRGCGDCHAAKRRSNLAT
jgi:hypothetical protein